MKMIEKFWIEAAKAADKVEAEWKSKICYSTIVTPEKTVSRKNHMQKRSIYNNIYNECRIKQCHRINKKGSTIINNRIKKA